MKRRIAIIVTLIALLYSFNGVRNSFFSIPKDWPQSEYNFERNSLTKEKIELGRALFYDPVLSRNNTISCASCHSPYNAFSHVDHKLSHGIDDRIGTRNAPALMNLAWQKIFMWDGAVNNLDMQALAPISHAKEMDEKIEHVVTKLQGSFLYRRLFYNAYDDSLVTGEKILKAISQFELTLVSVNSRYDSVMHAQTEFTQQEKNGYMLFKAHCNTCHAEPLFSTYEFANNGLAPDTILNDQGRIRITHDPADSLKFKIPTLRNIEYTYPYMHDGRFKTLMEVLNHYTSGIHQSSTLAMELRNPISLKANEKIDMVAFLLTLSDRKMLFNPEYAYPKTIFQK